MTGDRVVVVWRSDGGDYYAGESAAVFVDGVSVWAGSSCDEAYSIVSAVTGSLDVSCREVRLDRAECPDGPVEDWPGLLWEVLP